MNRDGFAFVIFLFLIALLASAVTMLVMVSSYNYQDTTSYEVRERGYQLARGALDLWIGHLRTDALHLREKDLPDVDTSGGSDPETNPWTILSQITMGDPDFTDDGGEADTLPYDAHTDDWGWASEILPDIPMGDTVYLPSYSSNENADDFAIFRIDRIQDVSGLKPDSRYDDPALQTTDHININTATYDALRSITMNPNASDDPSKLTQRMTRRIMERRSGTDLSSEPSVDDENYQSGDPEPFKSIDGACEFLEDMHDNFNCSTFARTARVNSEGLFVVEIMATSLRNNPNFRQQVQITALLDRREFIRGNAPIKILSVTQ